MNKSRAGKRIKKRLNKFEDKTSAEFLLFFLMAGGLDHVLQPSYDKIGIATAYPGGLINTQWHHP